MSSNMPSFSGQNKQAVITAIREYKEHTFIKHEREELLSMLIQTDSAKLRDFAKQEIDKLRVSSPGNHFFDI